jgi:uncharacterized protein YmfQ (DUF2313 family)
MNKAEENLFVIGKNLDIVKFWAGEMYLDLHAQTCKYVLDHYEKMYKIRSEGSVSTRRNRIKSAMRARGGLGKTYFEALGNTLGDGRYTVVITEGIGALPFITHTYSTQTTPTGPATLLPGAVRQQPVNDTCYTLTATITGGSSPEKDLESMYDKLRPAWTNFEYVYI